MGNKVFFISIVIAIFASGLFLNSAMGYSSADIPVRHWSYEAAEKLAIAGLLGLWGLDTKPMTRIQMAHKVKEAIENIEGERLPYYLALDREHVEYLQVSLYKLISEFRDELIILGVTAVEIEDTQDSKRPGFFRCKLTDFIETEQRFARAKSRKDVLLQNENGLMAEEGYNLRARAYSWVNAGGYFTLWGRPAFRLTENDAELFMDEMTAKASLSNVELSVGKGAMWWGPGFNGSMLMSNNAEPLTVIKVRSVKSFKLPGFLGKLGDFGANFFISQLEKDRAIERPNFIGLRLEWSPLPYVSLGVSRTAISGGKGRPKPRFKDYVKMFFARSKDEFSTGSNAQRTDSDQLASMDAKFVMPFRPEFRLASGFEGYLEWAGEDRFSFWENESPGLLFGILLTGLFRSNGTDFRFEYAKNKPAWYGHGLYNAAGAASAYTYKGTIMGHRMGGDADNLFFNFSKEAPFLSTPYFDTVKALIQLGIERHGLSSAVREKMIEMVVGCSWLHFDKVSFYLQYELENFDNYNFVSGQEANNHIISAELNIKF